MNNKRSHFKHPILPYLLLAPQVLITLIFFIWPALQAFKQSFFRGDAFGLHEKFAWFANFIDIFTNGKYLHSLIVTLIFSFGVSMVALASALFMASLTNRVVRGQGIYKSLLIWPYAVAPAVAGMIMRFLFNPSTGIITHWLSLIGVNWDYNLIGYQALILVVLAAAWQQFSYNFIFFLAGLQSIPTSLIEAAAIDGAGPIRRFWHIVLPLLSPITFFLLVMNLIYAFFSTFGVISVLTEGGPANATNILVYKVYNDGFVGLDLGGSAAQSVVLMLIVVLLTFIQFRYVERKVHY